MKKLTHNFRILKMSILSLLFIAGLLQPEKMLAQNRNYTPGKFLDTVIDYLGNKYALGQIAINDTFRAAASGYPITSSPMSGCSSGYFQLYLEPGCGLEGTASANVARRNVVCQVLYDLSQFIHSPLTTTGQKINIWVRCPDSVGYLPSNFLGLAASFYNVPYSTTLSGIQDDAVWITLNSGTDAYTNVASPIMTTGATYGYGATFYHGWMAFNFNGTVNWNTFLTGSPGAGEYDLYEVALHEMLHALGFVSGISYNGTSVYGTGYNYFTRYDEHLQTSSGTPLIMTSDACDLYQWGFNSSLTPSVVLSPGGSTVCPAGYDTGALFDDTVCTNAVNYVDGTMTQKVYTANCFQRGSSLSHFEDICGVPGSFPLSPPATNNQYFLMSNAVVPGAYFPTTNPGSMKRYPKPEERQVLCDIGYIVDTTFGSTTNLNYYNYHTTICGNQVAGINDGLTSGGSYSFFTTGTTPITINGGAGSLLNNDYGADSFKCLEVIEGLGTVSATHGVTTTSINFTPSSGAFGIQLLRYIPVNTTTGTEGNITYVYVYVGESDCTPSVCDLVLNGGFENVVSGSYGDIYWSPGIVHCWTAYEATPELDSRGAPSPYNIPNTWFCSPPADVHFPGTSAALPNDHYIDMISYLPSGIGSIPYVDALQSSLSASLDSGTTYVLSCWARMSNYYFGGRTTNLQFAVDTSVSPLAPVTVITGLPAGLIPIHDFVVPYTSGDTNWHYLTYTFTYTGRTAHTLIVLNAGWLNADSVDYITAVLLDDISIQPIGSVSTFWLPDTICTTGGLIDLTTLVSVPGGTFSWQTDSSGYLVTTHATLFNPDSATALFGGSSVVPICYYYTNSVGCNETVCATAFVSLLPSINGTPVICIGSPDTLTDSITGGIWSSNNTTIATVGSGTGIVTPVSVGIDTIIYTVPNGCTAIKIITVNTIPTTIIGTTNVCVGLTTTLSDPVSGLWTSSNSSIASVGSNTGIVSGIVSGTVTITYANFCGSVTHAMTVNPSPSAIAGATSICMGSTTSLTDAVFGGRWTSGTVSVASVGSVSGFVHSVSAGTTSISYTLPAGCAVGATLIVDPLPSIITGTMTVCTGFTTTLSDSSGDGRWSSSNTSIATVGSASGIVTGAGAGIVTITYTLPSGCIRTTEVAVSTTPSAISGPTIVCLGSTIHLTDPYFGGTWSSSNADAAVGSTTGIVTGVSGGTATISYTIASTGCAATLGVLVDDVSPITGVTNICAYGSTEIVADAETGGAWTSTLVSIAGGTVTSYAAGVANIYYTMPDGCFAHATLTVNPLPDPITGMFAICLGMGTTTLHEVSTGGVWSSTSPGIATIGSASGIVTAISAGTSAITYIFPATGCYQTITETVSAEPASIGGSTMVCSGDSITLSDGTGGGTWSSSNTTVATVGSTNGHLMGVGGGSAIITYSSGACTVTISVTVRETPAAISGDSLICLGTPVTLSDGTGSGTWLSSNPAVASLSPSGTTTLVTGLTLGTAIITYSTGSGASLHCRTTKAVTVSPAPAPIAGLATFCGTGSVTFTDDSTGGVWSATAGSLSASVGSATGIVVSASAGAATITYTLPGGCYSTFPVTVSATDTAACLPCHVFSGAAYTQIGASGTINTSLGAGSYYIANNVTIMGTLTFTDAVIFIAPGVTVSVNATSSLTLDGCHLFSCAGNMWQGIVLESLGTQTGTITLDGDAAGVSTLIEDAIIPVDVESPLTPTGSAPLFVASLNTVFNRCDTAIKIANYSPTAPLTYPFLIQNTVFTSRNLWSTPNLWASAATLKAYLSPLTPYIAPYNVVSYAPEQCHNFTSGLQTVGIYLRGIGTGTYPNYAGIVVGDSLPNLYGSYFNLFDTLSFGIRGVNANVTVHNNVFAHMVLATPNKTPDNGGAGVYANMNDGTPYRLVTEAVRYAGSGSPAPPVYFTPNYFYNCPYGVAEVNYSDVAGTGNYMITTQSNAACCSGTGFVGSGFYGYDLQSGFYHVVNVSNNTIINTDNGIAFKAAAPGLITAVFGEPGTVYINNNSIQATVPGGLLTTQYVDKPIWAENVIAYYYSSFGLSPSTFTALRCDGNIINNAYNGIYVNGIGPQLTTSNTNTINLVAYPMLNPRMQYGVEHNLCQNDQVVQNAITGPNYTNDSLYGVLEWSSDLHDVFCNEVITLGRGIELDGTVLGSTFGTNTMTNNGKGFVLGGVIGTQGSYDEPSDNVWLATGGFAWSALTHPQTYTQFHASPTASPLVVRPGGSYDPVYNYTTLLPDSSKIYGRAGSTITGSGNGLVVSSFPAYYGDCDSRTRMTNPLIQMEQVARQVVTMPSPHTDYWMSQFALWIVMANDTLGDTSAVLDTFRAMATHSRFWLLTQIENQLSVGNAIEAQNLLDSFSIDSLYNVQHDTTTGVQMADDTTADNIVANYRQFYQLYVNYLSDTLSSSDTAEITVLANLCPLTNGDVVFKARALYDVVNNVLQLFPSGCADTVRIDSALERHSMPYTNGITATTDSKDQKYILYPNPNDGNFILQQAVADSKPVQIEIWDVLGRSLYKQTLEFADATYQLQVRNVAPGLYLLQVTDNAGRTFKFKFVVQ